MEYFGTCNSIEELKGEYKVYLEKNKGDAELIAEINKQYQEILEELAIKLNVKIDEENRLLPEEKKKAHYNKDLDKYAEILQKIISFNMNIEIIGQWIWCFDSYEYREQLKNLGFWYTASKKAWVYNGEKKKFIRSRNKIDDVRKKWGCEQVREKEEA